MGSPRGQPAGEPLGVITQHLKRCKGRAEMSCCHLKYSPTGRVRRGGIFAEIHLPLNLYSLLSGLRVGKPQAESSRRVITLAVYAARRICTAPGIGMRWMTSPSLHGMTSSTCN